MGRKKIDKAQKVRKGRANGHGSLERRPNGSYLARWVCNGKRYSQLIKDDDGNAVTDKRQAEQLLEKITAPYRLGSEAETAALLATKAAGKQAEIKAWHDRQPALPLGKAFDAYRASLKRPQGAGAAALDRYETYYNHFTEWLKANRPDYTELRDVTGADANAYSVQFLTGHTGGTFNKHLALLRSVWRVLDEDDADKPDEPHGDELPKAKLTCNPWAKIRNRQHTPHRKRELTLDELRTVCAKLDGEMRLLFALGIYTGQRLGDCCLLQWSAVDMRRGVIHATPHKTMKHGTQVLIPLRPELAAMLAATPAKDRTEYVLPETAAAYLHDPIVVSNRVQAVFEGNGIKTTTASEREGGKAQVEVGFHSLRHTFVSLLGNAGASLALVQSMVGHTSKAMTQHYFHESEAALRGAVNLLPNVIDIEATVTPASEPADTGRLADFRKLVQAMTADERKAAAKWLANFNKTH